MFNANQLPWASWSRLFNGCHSTAVIRAFINPNLTHSELKPAFGERRRKKRKTKLQFSNCQQPIFIGIVPKFLNVAIYYVGKNSSNLPIEWSDENSQKCKFGEYQFCVKILNYPTTVVFVFITDRQLHSTVYRRWPSFPGRCCSCLEQSASTRRLRTLSVAVFRSYLKTHLFRISHPTR